MLSPLITAPQPDLRILAVDQIVAHEEHDSQRSDPLMKRLVLAEVFTNPPVVAPMDDGRFVVLDGANRYHCFSALGFPHLLVQVVDYKSGFVELGVWNHVITEWDRDEFQAELERLPDVKIRHGWDHTAVAQVLLSDGLVLALDAPNSTIEERNQALRELVHVYLRRGRMHRSALHDPTLIWPLYPRAVALVLFPPYTPDDIISAARHQAFLPPGISRHIIHGRALKLFYPMDALRDTTTSTEGKNAALQEWVLRKLSNREVRYYAEATYQFDE